MPGLVNFDAAPHSVTLQDMPIPDIDETDVLLKVQAVGVCGSDLHQWHGTHSWPVNYPCILGHEFAGRIEKVGAQVRHFNEGDRVVSETAAVINPQSPFSRSGLYNLDPSRLGFGYGVDGAMTHYVRVPERCLHTIPDSLPFEVAALSEPCSVAYNAVCVQSRIRPGDSVLVIGPGPIGLLCGALAALNGAGNVIVSGLPQDAFRLEVALSMGAHHTTDGDVETFVKDMGYRQGVDLVIDAAGVSSTLEQALACVRPAGQITKVGWGPHPLNFSLDALVQKAVTLQGSFSHNWPTWERVIQLLSSGQLNISPILNRVAPLEEWNACFEGMLNGRYVKTVLTPNSSSKLSS